MMIDPIELIKRIEAEKNSYDVSHNEAIDMVVEIIKQMEENWENKWESLES